MASHAVMLVAGGDGAPFVYSRMGGEGLSSFSYA